MPGAGNNLGGREYLVGKLRERGLSRRDAVRILNAIFGETIRALGRGQSVEFPFGSLKRIRRVSKRWLEMGDEPVQPYTVEHGLDERWDRLLNGSMPTTGVTGGHESSQKKW